MIEDATLNGHVQSGRRFVSDQQLRASRHSDSNQHALTHTAGELVRVLLGTTLCVRQAGLFKKLSHALTSLGLRNNVIGNKSFLNLRTNAQNRVQVRHRVLGNQADTRASQTNPFLRGEVRDLFTVEFDGTAGDLTGAREQADDRSSSRRLTGTGLAYDGDRLAWVDGQVCATDSRNDTGRRGEGDLKVSDLQKRVGVLRVHLFGSSRFAHGLRSISLTFAEHHLVDGLFDGVLVRSSHILFAHLRAFGSRASRTASPIMMKLRTVIARAKAG